MILLFEIRDIDYRKEALPLISRYNSFYIYMTDYSAIVTESKLTGLPGIAGIYFFEE